MKNKKLKSKKNKVTQVNVVNDSLNVGVTAKPCLVTLFEEREVSPGSSVIGPLGGLNLTGYGEYRLTLHFAGTAGTKFSIAEICGPAGAVDQVKFEVGSGSIGPQGTLNYRARFDLFSPRNLFIQVHNEGDEPCQVDGTLYAVQ
ncbi:MAG: hypothetical protein ABW076_01155 [Candidatus Thiodiazotropha sp.]